MPGLVNNMSTSAVKTPSEEATPIIQKISPRLVPGPLTSNNKGALDWGWQNLLAYGCHNHVIVIDTKHMKVFQTLEKHKTDVNKVKWCSESHYHDLSSPYSLQLASADITGNIIVWDVTQTSNTCLVNDTSKPILELEWLNGSDLRHPYLLSLHSPGSLILWNTETGEKQWKKVYQENLQAFSIDPFANNKMAFLANDCIIFMDDLNLNKMPPSSGRKFYISNQSASFGSQTGLNMAGSNSNANSNPTSSGNVTNEGRSRSQLARRMRVLIGVESKSSSEERTTLNECLQLGYHRSYRHHLLLLYPKEILVLDLEINQTVGIVALDRNAFPLVQLFSCQQRDVLICLHDQGNVSLKLRHRKQGGASPSDDSYFFDSPLEVSYENLCQSECLRYTKHSRVVAMAINANNETQVALLVNDGRILTLDVLSQNVLNPPKRNASSAPFVVLSNSNRSENESMFEPSCGSRLVPVHCTIPTPKLVLSDIIPMPLYNDEENLNVDVLNDNRVSGTKQTKQSLKRSLGLQFLMTGLLGGLSSAPQVIRMCPPVTFRNWPAYVPLMAVGNSSGSLQILNMATGAIEKELSIHTAPVRGIEWVGLRALISFAHPGAQSNSNGWVKNELVLTDVDWGRTLALRAEQNEESPIEMIRVSCQRQYFIVAFRDQPFELWDLNQLVLIRTMPKTYHTITALEWSPFHSKRSLIQQDSVEECYITTGDTLELAENPKSVRTLTKEHFVFTDTEGQLYNCSVEGNVVRNGKTVPSDPSMGMINCIAWKGDHIILGDIDGNLNLWNVKAKISRCIPTHRGCIKKLRLAPGRGNMKLLVLYNDGTDLFDVKEAKLLSSARSPKDMPKILDLDWAGSERPVLATQDGCLRICDIQLQNWTSPLSEYFLSDAPFCPHLLSLKGAFTLKSMLQYQPIIPTSKIKIKPSEEEFDFVSSVSDEANSISSLSLPGTSGSSVAGFGEQDSLLVLKQLESLENNLKSYIASSPFGTAERCLLVSRLFGDAEGVKFWTVTLHYLKRYVYLMAKESEKTVDPNSDWRGSSSSDLISPDQVLAEPFYEPPLDTVYDFLMENHTYQRLQLDRTSLHDCKRVTVAQTQQCVEDLLLLKQWDRAVQLLLETEPDAPAFHNDCLRACLVATVKSSTPSQSVIKLVATNLIASGRISEGAQLLSLIEKGTDACRYLQAAGMWDRALWLAKATLDTTECSEVLRRYVDHLASTNHKNLGVLILISEGQFWKALTYLHSWSQVERAAMLLLACREFGIILNTNANAEIEEAVLMNYVRYLCSISNYQGALKFCELVGSQAEELKREIQEFCESS